MPAIYGKRRKPTPAGKNVPKSPARRLTPWTTLTIRSEHYAMLRELADLYETTIGQAAMDLIEHEFKKKLWEQTQAARPRHAPRA